MIQAVPMTDTTFYVKYMNMKMSDFYPDKKPIDGYCIISFNLTDLEWIEKEKFERDYIKIGHDLYQKIDQTELLDFYYDDYN